MSELMTVKPAPSGREQGEVRRAVARIHRMVQRCGWAGSVRLLAKQAGRLAYLNEAHVWYWLDLSADRRPAQPMPSGLRLVGAGEREARLLDQLATVDHREACRRLRAGAELWMVVEGTRTAFACWTYQPDLPTIAAPGGVIRLPRGVVGLEDSVTAPEYHEQSIAPAAWSALADTLAKRRVEAILTRVEEPNLVCRRAIEKTGFTAVASMQLERIGTRARVEVRSYEPEGIGALLAAQLAERGGAASPRSQS